jgi:hypothetical protein
MKSLPHIWGIALLMGGMASCSKSSFLNTKPNQSLVVPSSIADCQAILDNDGVMTGDNGDGVLPSLGEVGSTDFYSLNSDYNTRWDVIDKNAYVWNAVVYEGNTVLDWDYPYLAVFYANQALSGLASVPIPEGQQGAWNNAEGQALFMRAIMFHDLAQVFAPPFDSSTASTDWGIPLKLSPDVTEQVVRATVRETYTQIIKDLKGAIALLPLTQPYPTRPNKSAAYGLMARVYQSMGDDQDAFLYADSSLQLTNTLLNFNSIAKITRWNVEVQFSCLLIKNGDGILYYAPIDSNLYSSYQSNDLRKTYFFSNYSSSIPLPTFHKGSYNGGGVYLFGGIATDEVYLIRAECNARLGNTAAAMSDLNTLLVNRYATGTFVPYTATGPSDALTQILTERRKELLMRGLRWMDLRRLNKDPDYAVTLTRVINGQTYTLPPGDPRYTYPIPDDVISFNPTMPQNVR